MEVRSLFVALPGFGACRAHRHALPCGPDNARLIRFVTDRPGHDWRYAIDATRMREELDWMPKESFETGIVRTVDWYLGNLFRLI